MRKSNTSNAKFGILSKTVALSFSDIDAKTYNYKLEQITKKNTNIIKKTRDYKISCFFICYHKSQLSFIYFSHFIIFIYKCINFMERIKYGD